MFFIMGGGSNSKQLSFDQTVICKCCQKYGHIQVFVTYSYVSLFFIPLFKWNKRYFAKMSCCNSVSELSSELGREIEKGNITSLGEDFLNFHQAHNPWKCCSSCGYTTSEEFEFCPKCGRPFSS